MRSLLGSQYRGITQGQGFRHRALCGQRRFRNIGVWPRDRIAQTGRCSDVTGSKLWGIARVCRGPEMEFCVVIIGSTV